MTPEAHSRGAQGGGRGGPGHLHGEVDDPLDSHERTQLRHLPAAATCGVWTPSPCPPATGSSRLRPCPIPRLRSGSPANQRQQGPPPPERRPIGRQKGGAWPARRDQGSASRREGGTQSGGTAGSVKGAWPGTRGKVVSGGRRPPSGGLLSVIPNFSRRPRTYRFPEFLASSKPIQAAAPVSPRPPREVPPRLRVLPCPSSHFLHASVPTSSPCAPVPLPDPNPPCPRSPTHLCPWSTPRSRLHAPVPQVSTFLPGSCSGTRSLRVARVRVRVLLMVAFPHLSVSPVSASPHAPVRQAEPRQWKLFLYSAPGRLRSQAHGEPADGIRALQDHVRHQKAEAWKEGGGGQVGDSGSWGRLAKTAPGV